MISFREFILENFYVGDDEKDTLPLTEKEKRNLGKILQKENLSIQKMEWHRSSIKDIIVQKIVKQLKGRKQVFLLHTEKTVAIEGVPANCHTFLLCYDSNHESHITHKSSFSVQSNDIDIQSINLYAISESGQLLGRHTTTTHNRRIIDSPYKKRDNEANENFDEIFKQIKKVKPDVYIGNIGKGYNGEADVKNLQKNRKMAQDDSVDPLKMREKNAHKVEKDRVDLENLHNEVSDICKEYNSMIDFLSSKTKNAISPIKLPKSYGTVTASNSDAFKKWFEEDFKPKVDMINDEIESKISDKYDKKELNKSINQSGVLYEKYRAADIALDKEKRHINTVFKSIKLTYSNTLENHFYDNKSNSLGVKPSGRYSNVITPANIFIALNSIWSKESLKTEISEAFKTIKDFLKD